MQLLLYCVVKKGYNLAYLREKTDSVIIII